METMVHLKFDTVLFVKMLIFYIDVKLPDGNDEVVDFSRSFVDVYLNSNKSCVMNQTPYPNRILEDTILFPIISGMGRIGGFHGFHGMGVPQKPSILDGDVSPKEKTIQLLGLLQGSC